ncbi:serine hydrolase domain-containing protein [uncultured Sphingomonas sp.]|uniref:serine hydrolase domain-containing protein n=1 Tax=uncultured Sphingomonas sp. TaxID=158754 RepID=UPI0035CBB27D
MGYLRSFALALAGIAAATIAPAQMRAPLAPPLVPSDIARPTPSAVAGTTGGHVLDKADADTWLDGYMPYALRTADIPGAVVTIVKDGRVLTARGFGYADVGKRTPVDPERTMFRPGSVSKLVTWTAVMQLVDQRKLDLDADVNTYLDFRIPPRDGKPITLRQIMTHTAGFEESGKGVVFFDPKGLQPLGQYLKAALPERIFEPGTTPAYSNYATALAGYIVQRVSGEPFNAYVEQHIFVPLGMTHSSFRQPLPPALRPLMATGYAKPGQVTPYELVGPAPAGALASSGVDMARFMLAHLGNGQLGGARILSPATAQEMHDSPLAHVDLRSLIPPLSRMELGFFETNINGREVIGHLGDLEAFHTSLHLFTREGVGFYVSFNSPGKAAAVQTLRTALFQDFADRYFPNVAGPDGRIDAKTSAEHARMMSGLWWASRRGQSSWLSLTSLLGQAKIGVGPKGELIVPSVLGANGRPREWVEVAPFVWRDAFGHDRLAAQVKDGAVVRWSYDFASPFEVFDRVPFSRSSAWLLPALYASLAVLLLSFFYWPAGYLIRRRYGARAAVTGPALRAYRATRLMTGLDLLVLVGWAILVSSLAGGYSTQPGGLDGGLWLLQIAGVIIFPGAAVIAAWNMVLTWRDGRRWTRKLWSVLVFVATLVVLYLAVTFGLIAMTVKY